MGTDTQKMLIADYQSARPLYENLTRSVAELLHQILEARGIDHLPIEGRTKGLPSFGEKISRPEKADKYADIADVTDLSGVRVIVYLQEDISEVERIIEDNFDIDDANSVRKDDLLDPDRFGYLSRHYVVSYNEERLRLPEFGRFEGLKSEIQIRTVLQHSWAAIDWKLRYKSKVEVPAKLRRRLYRISALLEAADDEFAALSVQVGDVRLSYQEAVERGDYDLPLDAESLGIFIRKNKKLNGIYNKAKEQGLEIVRPPEETHGRLASLLYSLEAAGLSSLKDVVGLLKGRQAEHIARLKVIYYRWLLMSETTFAMLSIETMMRVLAIAQMDQKTAEKMLLAAPINFHLGIAVQDYLNEKGAPQVSPPS